MQFRHTVVAVAVLAFSFAVPLQAQSIPEPVPGVHITNGSIPWAVDVYKGKQELVPIHHTDTNLNNHKGANVAGGLAGSFFYKPKATSEISGTHARVALHTDKPVFYVHLMSDPGGDTPDTNWAIVRAVVKKDHRILAQIRFTPLTDNAKRSDSQVETAIESLPDGWLKITPTAPLAPGEYALMPIFKAQNSFSTVVFDFSLDPNGPNAPDALSAQMP